MSLRILVAVLFVGGCAGRQPVTTAPPPHVVWVPEARALLGHVEDDALADFDAELERVRAIARFEIETEDPDHEGLLRLMRLHRFDAGDAVGRGDEAVRAAQSRVMASADVLVGALMLEGREAFDVVLSLAPNLLVERPDEVNRFLRSGFLLMRGTDCGNVTRGFFVDRVSRLIECEGRIEPRVATLWASLEPSVRASFRARGIVPEGDVLTAAEASTLVEVSFWGAQAYLHQLVGRGDVSSANNLSRALLTRDPSDIPARLVLAVEREIASGAFGGDRESVGALVRRYGPRHVSYRFPESNVAKIVVLEQLAMVGLAEDFARVRGELSDASLAMLGPVLDVLDATLQGRRSELVRARDTLLASDSVTLRAYGLGFERDDPRTGEPRLSDEDWTSHDVQVLLTLDPPPTAPWWLPLTSLPSAMRARLIARVDAPLLASRAGRRLCWPQTILELASCTPRVDAMASIAPIDLDAALLRALEATPYWSAPVLATLLDRLEGGPVSARPAYVYHRIKALIFGGRIDEARRRFANEGRILSRVHALLLDAALIDAAAGHLEALVPERVATIDEMFVFALEDGCSAREADEETTDATLASDHLIEALQRTRAADLGDSVVPVRALRPLLSRFEGRSKQTLAMILALDALERRDRAQFEADLAVANPRQESRFAQLLTALAASAFSTSDAVPEHDWVREEATYVPGNCSHGSQVVLHNTEAADPDVSALSGPAAEAYAAAMGSSDPEARSRFLRMRAPDDLVRRLQCRVALDELAAERWMPGYLGVEPPRRLRTRVDRMEALCRVAPEASSLARRSRFWLARPVPAPTDDAEASATTPPLPEAFRDHHGVEQSAFIETALMSSPPDHMLSRLAGLDAPLSLVLEGRHVDARRAAEGNPRDVLAVRLLSEDLAARRIDPHAALALVWISASRDQIRLAEVLDHLLDTNPRSKMLAFATIRYDDRRTIASLRSRLATQLIACATNDVELLIHLADAFRRDGSTTHAARAIARVRTLEPNARTTLADEAAADCAPE